MGLSRRQSAQLATIPGAKIIENEVGPHSLGRARFSAWSYVRSKPCTVSGRTADAVIRKIRIAVWKEHARQLKLTASGP
jgi:hypothetical protein